MMKNILTLLLITFSLQSFGQGFWYRDFDGDGFGDPDFSIVGAFPPPRFVADNTDCDDFNPFVKPDNVWYKDKDSDGFTDGTFVEACYQPVGYLRLFGLEGRAPSPEEIDCDDNDPSTNIFLWYLDKDRDGYIASLFPIITCQDLRGAGYTRDIFVKGLDCNDDDANIYILVLYLDNDRDGFPASSEPIETCGGIASHPYYLASQLNSLAVDCDDSDQNNIPTTVWFEDQDNDGYTNGVSITSCVQPSGFIQNPLRDGDGPNLLLDCNDKDAVQRPNQNWYEDNDRDGYGKDFIDGGQLILACQRPKGNWFARSELTALGDCNDNVASLNPTTQWVLDGDGDGYYFGDKVVQCSSPGPGYLVFNTQLPGDCDDNNADINPKTLWVLDADGDGYKDRLYFASPEGSCTPPQDGRNYIYDSKGSDCNDNDATNNPETIWVVDKDGDGYYSGDLITGCQLFFIEGLVKKTTQQPGDCDDNDANFNLATFWLLDADKDGYHEKLFIAEFPSCLPPQDGRNYINNSKGQDCNDNDSTYTPETVWVKDADGDGYFIGEPLIGCLPIFTTGYVKKTTQQPGDCNDDNSAINPGATEACDGIDNNCNLQIDEGFPDSNNNGVADCVDPDNDMVSFTLINAGTDLDILTLTDGLQISQNQVQGLSLNIRANTNPSVVGSVFITISGPVSRTITENVAPYALFGDRNGDYNGRNLPSGNYTLTATPYSQTNRGGTAGSTTTLRFSIVPTPVPVIGSFTLINAGTDTDILTLTDGLRISQSQVQGLSLNIRANTNPSVVGSVFLRISGPVNRSITENRAPYALFGDRNGDYNGRNLPVGNYTLEATPYSQSNRRGTMGSTLTIKFSITSEAFRMDGTQTESDESENPQENNDVMEKDSQARDIPRITRMYPNPVAEIINLELSGQVEEQVEVSIYDLKGVRLFNQEFESENGKMVLDISNLGLKPGMFVLMVNTNGYLQTFKFLKK